MPADFSGNYEYESSENFEKFLDAVDAPFMVKKAAPKAKPSMEIKQDGDNFEIKMKTTLKTETLKFTIGKEMEHDNLKGDTMVGTANWDGDKIVVDLKPKKEGKGKAMKNTRELSGDKCILTMECEGVTCKRIFKKK